MGRMKICLDIQPAVAQRAGVGRYTKQLAEALPALADDLDLAYLYFDFRRQGHPLHLPSASVRAVRWCPGWAAQQMWKRLNWPPFNWFAGDADLYHFSNFIIPPLTRGRATVSIHDLSFMRHPEFTEEGNLAYLRAKIPATVKRADAVLTISEFSRQAIIEELNVPEERVHLTSLGVDPLFKRASQEQIAATKRNFGMARPYLLYVSTVEPRKNHRFLLDVFARLGDLDIDLVIAGGRGWKSEPVFEAMGSHPLADRIHYIEYVGDEHLPALYSGAEIFVMPSFYEGFGLPPLEAMACGTPTLVAPAGSIAEVVGDAAEVIADFDHEQWETAIRRLLTDSERRAELSRLGPVRSATFTWERTARETLAVFRSVLS